MKKLLLLITIIFPMIAFAQKAADSGLKLPIDSTTRLITYQEVVQVPGASKDDLYLRSREWFARTFKSSQEVIQMDDKAAGKVIGKGAFIGSYTMLLSSFQYVLYYTVSITSKDGRYRYEISDMNVKEIASQYSPERTRPAELYYMMYNKGTKGVSKAMERSLIPNISRLASELTSGIKSAMEQPAQGTKSKDDF